MRRLAWVAAALALAACQKKLSYQPFTDPSGFSADVPSGWAMIGDKDLTRKPVAVVTWVGEMVDQDEGIPIGAVINVTRVTRRREDFTDEKSWQRFKADWLDRSDKLFENAQGDSASFTQDFEMHNKVHGLKPTPMKLEDVVLRAPDAYWVLDYRAMAPLFAKYAPAFERFKQTAKPGK